MYKLLATENRAAYEISELAKMFVSEDDFMADIATGQTDKDEIKRCFELIKNRKEGT